MELFTESGDPTPAALPRSTPDPRDKRNSADPNHLTDLQLAALQTHNNNRHGLTDFELSELICGNQSRQTNYGKRRLELELADLIEYTGLRRDTGNGGKAGVYVITPLGIDVAHRYAARAAA